MAWHWWGLLAWCVLYLTVKIVGTIAHRRGVIDPQRDAPGWLRRLLDRW